MHRRSVHLGRRYSGVAPQDRRGGISIRQAQHLGVSIVSNRTSVVICDLRACHLSIVYAVRVGLREMLIFV